MVFPFLPCTLTHRTESCTARRDGKDDSSPIVSQGLTIDGDGRRIYGRETLPFDRVGPPDAPRGTRRGHGATVHTGMSPPQTRTMSTPCFL